MTAPATIPAECPHCGAALDYSRATHASPATRCPKCGALTTRSRQVVAWMRRHGRAAWAAVAVALALASCGDVAVRARVRVTYPGGECSAECEVSSEREGRCACEDPCAGLEGDALLVCVGAEPVGDGGQQ